MSEPEQPTHEHDAEAEERSERRGAADRSPTAATARSRDGSAAMSERPRDELTTADLASAGAGHEAHTGDRDAGSEGRIEPLFAKQDAEAFRTDWKSIQAGFVDEPRRAVEQADKLVAEVIQRLAKVFADERSTLEADWSAAGDVDTEQFRLALRRYRSFFDRLLSV